MYFFFLSFYNKIYRMLKTMGLVQLLTALYSYRFTSNVKEKPKPRVASRPHRWDGAGSGAGGGGGCSVAAFRDRVFGKKPNPILPNLYIYMQVLDAGKGSICNPSLRAMPTDGPLSADCSVVIGQNWFNTPHSKLGGKGKKERPKTVTVSVNGTRSHSLPLSLRGPQRTNQ